MRGLGVSGVPPTTDYSFSCMSGMSFKYLGAVSTAAVAAASHVEELLAADAVRVHDVHAVQRWLCRGYLQHMPSLKTAAYS